MPFEFNKLAIEDVVAIQPKVFGDDRGFFAEQFKQDEFAAAGIDAAFVQVNHSKSSKGVLRGLHYQQDPKAQGKLITVVSGEVYDVAVDIRAGSPTFGQWVGHTLSAEKKNMVYVPAGFAHGFCVLSDDAEIIYYCTESYAPETERGIAWDDATLNIDWPVEDPVLSDKDKAFPAFAEADINYTYTVPASASA